MNKIQEEYVDCIGFRVCDHCGKRMTYFQLSILYTIRPRTISNVVGTIATKEQSIEEASLEATAKKCIL